MEVSIKLVNDEIYTRKEITTIEDFEIAFKDSLNMFFGSKTETNVDIRDDEVRDFVWRILPFAGELTTNEKKFYKDNIEELYRISKSIILERIDKTQTHDLFINNYLHIVPRKVVVVDNKEERERAIKILDEAIQLYYYKEPNGIIETDEHKLLKRAVTSDFYEGLEELVYIKGKGYLYATGLISKCSDDPELYVTEKTLANAVLHVLKNDNTDCNIKVYYE